MNIGDNIKKYRKQKNLTQKQLAEAINKSKSTIEKYEANKIEKISINTLEDISKALDIPITKLCGTNIKQGFLENIDVISGDKNINSDDYIKDIINNNLPNQEKYTVKYLEKICTYFENIFLGNDIEFEFKIDNTDLNNIELKGILIDTKDGYTKVFNNIDEIDNFYNEMKFFIQSSVDRFKYIDKMNK